MRVPIVLLSRLFLTLCLSVLPSVSAAATTPPPDAGAIACDQMGSSWLAPDGTIVIDRRKIDHSGVRDVTFRLDDTSGYWLYPPTSAAVVVLPLPDGAGKPLSVSIARVTTVEGVATVCAPSVDAPGAKPPADAPAPDGPSVDRRVPVAHTADPLTCDDPFAAALVVNAVSPDVPPLAVQEGVSGIVRILIKLDPDGRVTSAVVTKSASSLLSPAALSSARRSQYRPATFRCRPIASEYTFVVEFARRY